MDYYRRLFSHPFRERTKTLRLFLLGIFVNVTLFAGIIDINFVPTVKIDLPSHNSNITLCKRVVVFVSDGLRADGIFSMNTLKYTPYLSNIKDNVGAWGIAHTRATTQSRPGHIALFGGMYEDPQAIIQGWINNPIDFDHIFNQSKASFLWGSQDVVTMFNKDNSKKIYADYYEPNFQDFSGQQSSTSLDDWVFEKIKHYFQMNHTELYEEQSIFFLHLLGIDTAGHIYKPNSQKYFDNLMFVDKGIENTVKIIEEFFNDNQTMYIFTSDHGMTSWGSHGGSSANETELPFIIWGSTVKQNSTRQDLQQVDITTIISGVLGINIPINSIGTFQEQFFDVTECEVATILFANMLTLQQQYKAQQTRMQRNLMSSGTRRYRKLRNFNKTANQIEAEINSDNCTGGILNVKSMIHMIENGKFYNKQQIRLPIWICLMTGSIAFMTYTASMILSVRNEPEPIPIVAAEDLQEVCSKIIFLLLAIITFLIYRDVEYKYCLYICFPLIIILYQTYDVDYVLHLLDVVFESKIKYVGAYSLILMFVNFLCLTFFKREYIFFVIIGVLVWIYLTNRLYMRCIDMSIWLSIMLCLPMFYSVSLTLKEINHITSILAALIVAYIPFTIIKKEITKPNRADINYFYLFVLLLQILSLAISCINIAYISYYNEMSSNLQNYIYMSTWIIFVVCLITMTLHPRKISYRSVGIQVSLFNMYFLMSFHGESLYLAVFICLCLTWNFTEIRKLQILDTRTFSTFGRNSLLMDNVVCHDDFRRCFIFITFILLSFFGAGNISDFSTFDPMWARCFVKVFNPYLIASLTVFKLIIPFFITTVTFQSINTFGAIPTINAFSIMLLYSEIMVFNLMFQVNGRGSWLEIALSISRFAIANLITIALLIIYIITKFLTENRLFDVLNRKIHKLFGIIVDGDIQHELINIPEYQD